MSRLSKLLIVLFLLIASFIVLVLRESHYFETCANRIANQEEAIEYTIKYWTTIAENPLEGTSDKKKILNMVREPSFRNSSSDHWGVTKQPDTLNVIWFVDYGYDPQGEWVYAKTVLSECGTIGEETAFFSGTRRQ